MYNIHVFNKACYWSVLLLASMIFGAFPAMSADPVGKYARNWCAVPENGEWIPDLDSFSYTTDQCRLNHLRIWTDCGDSEGISSLFNRNIRVALRLNAAFCADGSECGITMGDFVREEAYELRKRIPRLYSFQSNYFPPTSEQQNSLLTVVFGYDDQGTQKWCGQVFERSK